ncbi:hypothetical protein Pfo_011586, partial [Paulownia fortunei]
FRRRSAKQSVIKSNWRTTFFPGNNGFPVSISANMHPMLHISIAGRKRNHIAQEHDTTEKK